MALEIFGVITGIIYVFLESKQNKLLWPLGIITSGVYIWVFFAGKFYADMGLQVYYVLISAYGWYYWMKGERRKGDWETGRLRDGSTSSASEENGREGELPVRKVTQTEGWILGGVFILVWIVLYFVLHTFTDSDVPFGDSFTTALAIVATWMLARKILEMWFLWMIANVVSIMLYIYKGLYPTVILYIVYAGMSVYGYFEWRRSMRKEGRKEKGKS